jgi:hypothetical protein
METLYTSHEEHGSVAEIHSLLSLQPVFPSKLQWLTYEIQAELEDVASLPTLPELAELGVDKERYRLRESIGRGGENSFVQPRARAQERMADKQKCATNHLDREQIRMADCGLAHPPSRAA